MFTKFNYCRFWFQSETWQNFRASSLDCSLNWQHQLCKNPKPNPDIKTLIVDHSCGQGNARAPSPVTNPLMGPIPRVGFPPIGGPGVSLVKHFFNAISGWKIHIWWAYSCFTLQPFQHGPAPLATSLAGWMSSPSSVPHQAVSVGPMGLTPPNHAGN